MNTIENRQDMKTYIALKLGAGVNIVKVVISDAQYELLIDDALKYLWQYNWGRGSFTSIGALYVRPGRSKYHLNEVENENGIRKLLDSNIADVPPPGSENTFRRIRQVLKVRDTRMFMSGDQLMNYNFANYLGWMLNPQSPFGQWNNINQPGRGLGNISSVSDKTGQAGVVTGPESGWDVVSDFLVPIRELERFQQALAEFQAVLGTMYSHTFRQFAQELTIWPSPKQVGWLTLQYTTLENEIALFNDEMFQRLIIARAAQQLLVNLKLHTNEKLDLSEIVAIRDKLPEIEAEIENRSNLPRIFWR